MNYPFPDAAEWSAASLTDDQMRRALALGVAAQVVPNPGIGSGALSNRAYHLLRTAQFILTGNDDLPSDTRAAFDEAADEAVAVTRPEASA